MNELIGGAPFPRFPLVPFPQQRTEWAVVTTHVDRNPADMEIVANPGTSTGTVELGTIAGSAANCPAELLPQQETLPGRMAHW
jgi:hypothetical protein